MKHMYIAQNLYTSWSGYEYMKNNLTEQLLRFLEVTLTFPKMYCIEFLTHQRSCFSTFRKDISTAAATEFDSFAELSSPASGPTLPSVFASTTFPNSLRAFASSGVIPFIKPPTLKLERWGLADLGALKPSLSISHATDFRRCVDEGKRFISSPVSCSVMLAGNYVKYQGTEENVLIRICPDTNRGVR